ncbi:MAG: YggU family protein [Nanoarchaeota archaeon]|nr:YggU family protein [Nanoarchaeota archaeon]MBU1269872.1 YggU family protein [Nanoarchaeota archaeon]MBU1604268.1 YggU family protein [Nanoarchaeota archaeon]MBU2443680.1 YggU family protein [Nanoarchaeota archaeon]
MNIDQYIKNNTLKILVKPNSKKTKIVGFDEPRSALRVEVAAPPEDNKANLEVVKFFSKLLKKKVRIKLGLKSKEKVLQVY